MSEKRGPGRPPKNSAAGTIEVRSLSENEWEELPVIERSKKKPASPYADAAERLLRGEVVAIILPENKTENGAKIALRRMTKLELDFRFDPDRRLLGARPRKK